jgi:integrase
MAIKRRRGSPHWWYDFTINGRRFRGSTKTDNRETAEVIAAKYKSDFLIGAVTGRRPAMTLDAAFGRYWLEVAHRQPSAGNTAYQTKNLLAGLRKDRQLDDAWGDLSEYVAKRRGQVSDSSVNRELELLRRVLRRADTVWKVAVNMPDWQAQLLEEPDDVSHVLTADEEVSLFKHLRTDFHPMFRFALASGVRLRNCITLSWPQVDWTEMVIRFAVKSRKPGGKVHVVPITQAMAAILGTERGKHESWVFTYVCQRNIRNRKRGIFLVKGARYRFTQNGWRRAYYTARKAAYLPGLRFHDLRHTVGTRVTQRLGIKEAKDLLGHESMATTLRYAKSDVSNLRAALDGMATQSGHTGHAATVQEVGKKG